jgi:hypothetical protein
MEGSELSEYLDQPGDYNDFRKDETPSSCHHFTEGLSYLCFSPKSPPNSPNTELSTDDDLKGVYINYCYKVRSLLYVC